MRPVIALLTDFGTPDHYAGTMKGVMLGICPDVTLVDITHDIPPHDVLGGRAAAGGGLQVFSRRARSSSRSSIPASARRAAARRRHRRLPLRRARQRRADAGPARDAGEEDRRADRAPLRAADRQPHVRGARSLRAGRRLARQGHPALGARPAGRRLPAARHPAAGGRRRRACAASSCASIASATW